MAIFIVTGIGYSQKNKFSKKWSVPNGVSTSDMVPNVIIVKTKSSSLAFKNRLAPILPAIESVSPIREQNAALRLVENALSNVHLVHFLAKCAFGSFLAI